MNKLMVIAFAGILALAAGCTDKAGESPKTEAATVEALPDYVAIVNGVKISRSVFDSEVNKVTQNGVRKIPEDRLLKVKDGIVNRLIEEELLAQAVKAEGIVVTPEEIEAKYLEYKGRFKGEEQFANYLKHGNITEETIKERLVKSYSIEKLLEKMGKINITEEEVRNAYTSGIKMFTDPEEVHAAHILVRLNENATPAMEEDANKKIGQALSRIKAGEDFGEIAKSMSEDATTAPKGGDLGYVKSGVMVPAFEKVAFELEKGQYTKQAVRTPFGLHLIKVYDHKPEKVKELEEVRDKLTQSLKNKWIFKSRRELVRDLRAKATIEKLEGITGEAARQEAAEMLAPAGQPAKEQVQATPPAGAAQGN